ncbi:hypothetical protein L873DRAFT_1843894 [Choiromyces venosus 120613-1]|uniref:Uncharacterized protein n=1 Tax=Choiromyces venosus 120613-1 TaxID=1336337 RepID=A0A3N4JYR4_9PEZI|nr:hypothetical protein L873DRAFT_1843894 [Choiromyces venosus 120613-1]
MLTFAYASTNVTRCLSDGSRADIIHFIIVTGHENLRISASDFPFRIPEANITNPKIDFLANSASGSANGEPRANSEEETDPDLHDQADNREADVGNKHNLDFRWYFLSMIPAKRYLYWSGFPAIRYIPKSSLTFLHQADPKRYQFDWSSIAKDSAVYLCNRDGEVERLLSDDPIVTKLTFTSLGEPLRNVTGLDKRGLVVMSPGCYKADLFIDRLMNTNKFGSEDGSDDESEDGLDSLRDEATPLLRGMGSASKENFSFCGSDSLASDQDSNTDNNDLDGSQSTIRPILNVGVPVYDGAPGGLVTETGTILTAKPLNGNYMPRCVGSNEISKDLNTNTGGGGVSILTDSFAALKHLNSNPFADPGEVIPLYHNVFSSGEQLSVFSKSRRGEVCVESPDIDLEFSGQAADWMGLPEGTFDPRAPPFTVPASDEGGKQSNQPAEFVKDDKEVWPPRELTRGFDPIYRTGSFPPELEAFREKLGGVRNWCAFPPVQVSVEYLPSELQRLDWTGREGDKGGLADPILLGKSSSQPTRIDEGAFSEGKVDSDANHW